MTGVKSSTVRVARRWGRWGVGLVALWLSLLLSGSAGPPAPAVPIDACRRFLPLPPATSDSVHVPPVPDLPPPPARRDVAFRYAVHTLYLDEPMAIVAAEVGFDTVVQVFPWRDLNPAPGRYTWGIGDAMVRVARRYDLDLVVRLDMPPAWAAAPQGTARGLPFDLAAYADFVSAVAARYRGHVLGYIVWNEPNLAAEWSRSGGDVNAHWEAFAGWVADPADYGGVLGVAHARIRAADPEALVIGGGLAPTNETSPRATDDRDFLRGMLEAGAADCFDVLAVHDYGYGLPPDDPRGAHGGLNLARVVDLRDIMLAHGATQPVWITELGYTVQPGLHPDVSAEQQAAYLVGACERVRREWPWVTMFTVWNLCYGLPPAHEMSGYSLVTPDLTPRPAYRAVQAWLAAQRGE